MLKNTLAFILISVSGFAQVQPTIISRQESLDSLAGLVEQYYKEEGQTITKDSTEKDVHGNNKPKFFSDDALSEYFDQYFTLLNYQRGTIIEGNSASLKTTDNSTKLNVTLSKRSSNSIFSLSTDLNIKDNTGTLFTGDTPASGTQFGLSHTVLTSRGKSINYIIDNRFRNYMDRRAVLDSFRYVHVIKRPNQYASIEAKAIREENKYRNLFGRLEALKSRRPLQLDEILACQDSLVKALAEFEKADKELIALKRNVAIKEELEEIEKASKQISIKKQLSHSDEITTIKMQWFSYGINYKRESYNVYDSLRDFQERIGTKDFNCWGLTAGYNFYRGKSDSWKKKTNAFFASTYFGINYSLSRANNYQKVSEQNVSFGTSRTNADSVYEFRVDQKLRDISNKPMETFIRHRIGVQLTEMFGRAEFVGLNVGYSWDIEKSTTLENLRAGMLFRFKNSSGDKSFINFEVFVALNDLEDQRNTEQSIWKRKEIGLSASVPFEKVFFK